MLTIVEFYGIHITLEICLKKSHEKEYVMYKYIRMKGKNWNNNLICHGNEIELFFFLG
jgi:hypothetical protein